MAMLHERNVVFAEALYEFQESFEYFRTVFSRATESLPDLPLDLSDTDAFVKSNEYAKVQIQMSKNVQAVSQFLGTMDTNNLFLRVQSEISCREYLLRKLLSLPVVQQIPEVALKEQEEPELSCASLPDDGISPNTPSSVASGQARRTHARSVSPALRPPISISGCLDAAARATAAFNFLKARQYRALAATHFRHAASSVDLAWALLTTPSQRTQGVQINVKTAFELVQKCTSCRDSQGVVALCLYRGQGVALDKTRAVPLARQSAAAGSRYGQFALGSYYHDESDSNNAAANYKLSAQQGLDAAYYELGCMSQRANLLEEAA